MNAQQLVQDNLLANAPLYYESARRWMWDYCIYLGPYTDSAGYNYDLGVYLNKINGAYLAIVYGNEPGNYISGDILNSSDERAVETLRRARFLKLL